MIFIPLQDSQIIEVMTAAPEEFLTSLQSGGVQLKNVFVLNEITVRLTARKTDANAIMRYAENKGLDYRIIGTYGVKEVIRNLIQRPVLVVGVLMIFVLTLLLPTRIFFIQVRGNDRISSSKILDMANVCGIRFGASRRNVRSETVKNDLLSRMPELKWAGVNTYGCVAVITVKESERDISETRKGGLSHIISNREGIVTELTVSRGTALCSVGQMVSSGDILVSGITDCGRVVLQQRAEAEIFAITKRGFTAVYLEPTPKLAVTDRAENRLCVIFGKKLIKLWNYSGNFGVGYGKLYKDIYVHLPGGFRLPVALHTATHRRTVSGTQAVSTDQLASEYVRQNMIAGEVLNYNITRDASQNSCVLSCVYTCREMIGIEKVEENSVDYGQRD